MGLVEVSAPDDVPEFAGAVVAVLVGTGVPVGGTLVAVGTGVFVDGLAAGPAPFPVVA